MLGFRPFSNRKEDREASKNGKTFDTRKDSFFWLS